MYIYQNIIKMTRLSYRASRRSQTQTCPICYNQKRILPLGCCNQHVCRDCIIRTGDTRCPLCREEDVSRYLTPHQRRQWQRVHTRHQREANEERDRINQRIAHDLQQQHRVSRRPPQSVHIPQFSLVQLMVPHSSQTSHILLPSQTSSQNSQIQYIQRQVDAYNYMADDINQISNYTSYIPSHQEPHVRQMIRVLQEAFTNLRELALTVPGCSLRQQRRRSI